MSAATQTALNAYVQALQTIEGLEKGIAKAIQDFRALKDGSLTLDQLIVTDDGWQFMPPPPGEEAYGSPNGTADEREFSAV